VVNPHWVATECRQCHQMREREALPIATEAVDHLCLTCHDGRKAHAERHPTGRPISSPGIVMPQGWPAPAGRLSCITCHDLANTAGHRREREGRESNPDFLRGRGGPDAVAYCGRCHTATAQQGRFNPHRMILPDGRVDKRNCGFCHTRTFEPEQLRERTGQAALKRDVITLCVGCHTRHIDFFEPGHIGTRVTPEIMRRLLEMAAQDESIDGNEIERAMQQGTHRTRLPLGRAATVVCSTCHNPHEAGIFPPGSVLRLGGMDWAHRPATMPVAGAAPAGGSATIDVRLGPNLCGECHGK
jgi:hypothetical protein